MSSRVKYVCTVLFLFLVTLVILRYQDPKLHREEQHLTYNTELIDENTSIEADRLSSKLPVVQVITNGNVIPGKPDENQEVKDVLHSSIRANIKLYEQEGVLHTLQQTPDLESAIDIRIRGNSSRTFDKVGYLFTFMNAQGVDEKHDVMKMGKASTWVLHGPYVDKTLMRNYMWCNLSNRMMDWAPDVRFCEVFIDDVYQGVYVMSEQIDVDESRIHINEYDDRATVSSYIVSVDRPNINDTDNLNNFTKYSRRLINRMEVKYPGGHSLTPEVSDYISKDFSEFEKSLYSFDYDSETYGYKNFIDVDNFVNYLLVNEIAQNTDAGIFSTYFYKDVGGKLKLSVWDFNNSVDNYIEEKQDIDGFFMQNRTWFFMLMKDDGFVNKVIHRYKELRSNMLSDKMITSYIHDVDAYLGNAVDRNFQVWGYSFLPEHDLLEGENRKITSHEDAIVQYETRLLERLHWMDEHIEDIYSYAHESLNKKFND